mgnify:CR=1 FL=1
MTRLREENKRLRASMEKALAALNTELAPALAEVQNAIELAFAEESEESEESEE